ncbi:hypothetical protein D3C85_1291070 [compost metagenome]
MLNKRTVYIEPIAFRDIRKKGIHAVTSIGQCNTGWNIIFLKNGCDRAHFDFPHPISPGHVDIILEIINSRHILINLRLC